MSNNNPTDLILWHTPVHKQTKSHKHPRQIRRRKHNQPQKTQPRLRIASGPEVYEGRGQRVPEEREGHEGREEEERGRGVQEQPGKVGGGGAR